MFERDGERQEEENGNKKSAVFPDVIGVVNEHVEDLERRIWFKPELCSSTLSADKGLIYNAICFYPDGSGLGIKRNLSILVEFPRYNCSSLNPDI